MPALFSPFIVLSLLSSILLLNDLALGQTADELPTIKVWPERLPSDAKPLSGKQVKQAKEKNTGERIFYVDTPMLTVYEPPAEKKNGTAVVICPGGGYMFLAYKHEGIDLANWFNEQGVTAFLLKYRVPRRQKQIHWEPMQDVQPAIRICLLYTSPSPRDQRGSRMPSSA